jgi:hypothetical protein
MNQKLSQFIQSKISAVEHSIRAREQSAATWRRGNNESWRAVGCKKTKTQREASADVEERILVKLRTELEMFKAVLEIISPSVKSVATQ